MPRRSDKQGKEKSGRSAYDRALGLLARREHSQRELRARLERGGHDEAEAGAALDRLRKSEYQSDARFAEMLARARIAQGYGPARIRAELKSHGLGDAEIRNALDGEDADWNALAASILRKHYGAKPARDHAERGKRAAFLLRRGFSAATVRGVTHADVDDAGAAD